MKKVFTLILALVMIAGTAGCASALVEVGIDAGKPVSVTKRVQYLRDTVTVFTNIEFFNDSASGVSLPGYDTTALNSFLTGYFFERGVLRYAPNAAYVSGQTENDGFTTLTSKQMVRNDLIWTFEIYESTSGERVYRDILEFPSAAQYDVYRAKIAGYGDDVSKFREDEAERQKSVIERGFFYDRRRNTLEPTYLGIDAELEEQYASDDFEGQPLLTVPDAAYFWHGSDYGGVLGHDNGIKRIFPSMTPARLSETVAFNYIYASDALNGSNGENSKELGMRVFSWADIGSGDGKALYVYRGAPNLIAWYGLAIVLTAGLSGLIFLLVKYSEKSKAKNHI